MSVSTAYVLDASPFSRVGEMRPNLLEAQKDAVEHLIAASVSENGPSTASIIAMHSHPVQVCPHTNRRGVLQMSLASVAPERQLGPCRVDPAVALETALLGHSQRPAESGASAVTMFLVAPLTPGDASSLARAVRSQLARRQCNLNLYLVGKYREPNDALLRPLESLAPGFRVIQVPQAYTSILGFLEQRNASWAPGMADIDADDDEELRVALELSRQEYARERAAQAAQAAQAAEAARAESHSAADQAISASGAAGAESAESAAAASGASGIFGALGTPAAPARTPEAAVADTAVESATDTAVKAGEGGEATAQAVPVGQNTPGLTPSAPSAQQGPSAAASSALSAVQNLQEPPSPIPQLPSPPSLPARSSRAPGRDEDINIFGVSPNPWGEEGEGAAKTQPADASAEDAAKALQDSLAGELNNMDREMDREGQGSEGRGPSGSGADSRPGA